MVSPGTFSTLLKCMFEPLHKLKGSTVLAITTSNFKWQWLSIAVRLNPTNLGKQRQLTPFSSQYDLIEFSKTDSQYLDIHMCQTKGQYILKQKEKYLADSQLLGVIVGTGSQYHGRTENLRVYPSVMVLIIFHNKKKDIDQNIGLQGPLVQWQV